MNYHCIFGTLEEESVVHQLEMLRDNVTSSRLAILKIIVVDKERLHLLVKCIGILPNFICCSDNDILNYSFQGK